jgi:hypothetical protein
METLKKRSPWTMQDRIILYCNARPGQCRVSHIPPVAGSPSSNKDLGIFDLILSKINKIFLHNDDIHNLGVWDMPFQSRSYCHLPHH